MNSSQIPRQTSTLLFPLHLAAQQGQVNDLINQINLETCDPFQLDFSQRSALHYASNYGCQQVGLEMAKIILNSAKMSQISIKANLINLQDENGETALHLAARIGHRTIVQLFLFAGADVNIKSKQGVEPIELIYDKVPHAMCAIFDTAIQYRGGEIGDENYEIVLDFGPIVGYPNEEEKDEPLLIESELLAYPLKKGERQCKEILAHPLVQLFLEHKWKKVRLLFWTGIIIHILWLMIFSTFIVKLYLHECPYLPPVNQTEVACSSSNVTTTWAFTNIIITSLILLKEIMELMSVPNFGYYFKKLQNWGHLSIIVLTFITSIPLLLMFSSSQITIIIINTWQYQAAAMGVFLAWTLILGQIGKTPRLGIYVEILLRVLKSFGLFVLTFISLLIAFALSFSIIMPQSQAFSTIPLALSKVLSMMVGELTPELFTDIDPTKTPSSMGALAHLLFVIFVIIVTIIMFNLLIGLTVSDIQGLRAGARVAQLWGRLEQIYFMEYFIFSKRVQSVARMLRISTEIFRKFQIAKMDAEEMYVVVMPKNKIPKHLQIEVKELSTRNMHVK